MKLKNAPLHATVTVNVRLTCKVVKHERDTRKVLIQPILGIEPVTVNDHALVIKVSEDTPANLPLSEVLARPDIWPPDGSGATALNVGD